MEVIQTKSDKRTKGTLSSGTLMLVIDVQIHDVVTLYLPQKQLHIWDDYIMKQEGADNLEQVCVGQIIILQSIQKKIFRVLVWGAFSLIPRLSLM